MNVSCGLLTFQFETQWLLLRTQEDSGKKTRSPGSEPHHERLILGGYFLLFFF